MQFKKKLFKKRHGRKRLKILTAAGCIVIAAASAAFYLLSQEEKEDSQETGIQERISQISEIYTEEYQDSVKERLEKVKASGDYTEEYMLIEPDPFGTNPLSLYVYFKTDGPRGCPTAFRRRMKRLQTFPRFRHQRRGRRRSMSSR